MLHAMLHRVSGPLASLRLPRKIANISGSFFEWLFTLHAQNQMKIRTPSCFVHSSTQSNSPCIFLNSKTNTTKHAKIVLSAFRKRRTGSWNHLEATSPKTANTTLRNTMPSLYTHWANTTLGRQLNIIIYLILFKVRRSVVTEQVSTYTKNILNNMFLR